MSEPKSGIRQCCPTRKTTVEESLTLAIKYIRKRLSPGNTGTLSWTWGNGCKTIVHYFVDGFEAPLTMTLYYRWDDNSVVQLPVEMTTTPTEFDGRRWWFTCPLIVNGVSCRRRIGQLYLPPGEQFFGCRTCHDLTYRSCQESHKYARLAARYGIDPELVRWRRMMGRI